jgi:hypothetical protein
MAHDAIHKIKRYNEKLSTELQQVRLKLQAFRKLAHVLFEYQANKYNTNRRINLPMDYLYKLEDALTALDYAYQNKLAEVGRKLEERTRANMARNSASRNSRNSHNSHAHTPSILLPPSASRNTRDIPLAINSPSVAMPVQKSDTDITGQKFWNKVRQNMQGYTILIPYVKETSFGLTNGLFDILSAAFEGRVALKRTDTYASHLITEPEITEDLLARKISARSRILVSNSDAEKADANKWRVVDYRYIEELKRMNTEEVRRSAWELLSNVRIYNNRTIEHWVTDTSAAKEKVMRYCRFRSDVTVECHFVISREAIMRNLTSLVVREK